MTTIPYDQPRHRHLAGWLPFIRHYIEMVLAMAVGMFALMPLWPVGFRALSGGYDPRSWRLLQPGKCPAFFVLWHFRLSEAHHLA